MPCRACPQIVAELWRRWRRNSRQIAWLFLAIGLLGLSWQQIQSHLLDWQISQATQSSEYSQESEQVQYFPVHLKAGGVVDTPVALGYYQDGTWSNNLHSAVYLFGSGVPNQAGKTIIYGHNTNNIMGQLSQIQVDDPIILTLKNGDQINYRVTQSFPVNLTETEVLKQTSTESLLLYTCYGWLDNQRWIVLAEPQMKL